MALLRDIRLEAIRRLDQAGCDSPQLDVDLLLEEVSGLTPLDIMLQPDRPVSAKEQAGFQELFRRRAGREPMSQILGRKDFWSLTFAVNRHCLTPRPDSETLIEAALKTIPHKDKPLGILDLGTGSGCLILSLLSELPHSRGVAVDISDKALALARRNAENLGLQDRCEFIMSHWAEQLPVGEKFDIILCNPPYIAEGCAGSLAPEVGDYEPHMALFATNDGYGEYEKLAGTLPALMVSGGNAFLEVGHEQGQRVVEIFKKTPAKNIRIIQDLGRRDRCVAMVF